MRGSTPTSAAAGGVVTETEYFLLIFIVFKFNWILCVGLKLIGLLFKVFVFEFVILEFIFPCTL